MLKLYICPKCKTFRYVSKSNTTCFKCDTQMLLSKIPYSEFIKLNPEARSSCIEKTSQEWAKHIS